jgi:hypothetical protein
LGLSGYVSLLFSEKRKCIVELLKNLSHTICGTLFYEGLVMSKHYLRTRWIRTVLLASLVFFTCIFIQGAVSAQILGNNFGLARGQMLETSYGLTGSDSPTTPPPPTLTGPTVIVSVNPTNANPGERVEVDINVANLDGLYGFQTQCAVDPNVLVGTGHSDGTIFTSGTSFFVDNGFNAGNWTVAASLLQPNAPFSGMGVAYKLIYTVQNAGSSLVECTVLAVDENGHDLPATIINGNFNGAPVVEPTVVEPTVEAPEITPTLETPPVSQLSTIVGVMAYQNRPVNAGITVQLVTADTILLSVTTDIDGHYIFTDVAIGNYGITAVGPETLQISKTVDVTADGEMIDLGNLVLPAGDTDDNGTIDISDASLIGANFDGTAPPAPANADLNVDSKIDIRDLVLVGSNFGLTGPVIK